MLGSIWMFLAELFFMGVIFLGVGLLVRFVVPQALATETASSDDQPFIPLAGKHHDGTTSP